MSTGFNFLEDDLFFIIQDFNAKNRVKITKNEFSNFINEEFWNLE